MEMSFDYISISLLWSWVFDLGLFVMYISSSWFSCCPVCSSLISVSTLTTLCLSDLFVFCLGGCLFFPVLSNTFGVPMFSPFLFPRSSVSSLCLSRLSCLHVCLAPVPLSSPCVLVCFFLFYFDGPLSCVRDVEFCFLFLVSYDSVQLCSHASPIPLITLLYIYSLHLPPLLLCLWFVSFSFVISSFPA